MLMRGLCSASPSEVPDGETVHGFLLTPCFSWVWMGSRMLEPRFNGFVVAPFEAVAFGECSEFFGVAFLAVVFFLGGDVIGDFADAGMGDGECAVPAAPGELARKQVALIYPMGGAAFEELHHIFDCENGRKVD